MGWLKREALKLVEIVSLVSSVIFAAAFVMFSITIVVSDDEIDANDLGGLALTLAIAGCLFVPYYRIKTRQLEAEAQAKTEAGAEGIEKP